MTWLRQCSPELELEVTSYQHSVTAARVTGTDCLDVLFFAHKLSVLFLKQEVSERGRDFANCWDLAFSFNRSVDILPLLI